MGEGGEGGDDMRINSAPEVIIDSHSGYVCIAENGEKSSVVPSCGGGCSKTGPGTEGTEGYATHDYRILFSVVCHRPGLSVGEVSINRPPNAMELCGELRAILQACPNYFFIYMM